MLGFAGSAPTYGVKSLLKIFISVSVFLAMGGKVALKFLSIDELSVECNMKYDYIDNVPAGGNAI